MSELSYSFQRYLSAKKSVDERSLNQHVWRAMTEKVIQGSLDEPTKVLEIGSGTGTMFQWLLASGGFSFLEYTGIDIDPANIELAEHNLVAWAKTQGWHVKKAANGIVLSSKNLAVSTNFKRIDYFDFVLKEDRAKYDLIIANAFLDLVDVPAAFSGMFKVTRPGGLWYCTINFDGLTIFEPAVDPGFDELVINLYHRSMDERIFQDKKSGDSKTGRRLFGWLKDAGVKLLAAGGSDWVVSAYNGTYPEDEKYFLHHILYFFEQSLKGSPGLDKERFNRWLYDRHTQVERDELVYIAHQLDFLAQVPG
jgi:SAM-dependent methyltransferase